MLETIVRGQNAVRSFSNRVVEKVSNEKGAITVEYVIVAIVVLGLVIITKPLWGSTMTKLAGLWDTIMTDKINAAK